MPATELMNFKTDIDDNSFTVIRILAVDPSIVGSHHGYKYSLAYVVNGVCVLRYDNERGKGDHKHIGDIEIPVKFVDIRTLIDEFSADVKMLRRQENENA